MRFLGIDYGKRKIGLAISEGMSASTFKVIKVTGLNDALAKINQIIASEGVGKVVIGIPESGEAKNVALSFARELKGKIEVIEVDETLTTHSAQHKMKEMGVGERDRQMKEDAYAAVQILQEYLDQQAQNE